MIGFFRRIRKKLADDNKPMKYMRYAIGEIALVVIGILIALGINSTYNDYKEKKVEKTILNKLLLDIESDLEQLIDVESYYNRQLKYLKNVNNTFYNNDNDSIEYYIRNGYQVANLRDINPRTSTYDEMINSGKLYSLSNSSLTDLCIEYNVLLEKNTYETRQLRSEYKNIRSGPQMTEYWLLWFENRRDSEKASELTKSFVENKNSLAYKTLKRASGWGVSLIEGSMTRLLKIKETNLNLKEMLNSEIIDKK